MKLGDMLGLYKDVAMSHFVHAEALLKDINERLPTAVPLVSTNTGNEILNAMNALSTEDHVKMLMGEVNMSTGALTLDQVAPGVVIGMPPKRNAQSIAALAFGGVLVFIALLLAVTQSYTAVKTGQMPDGKTLETVSHVVGDVINSLNNSAQQSTQPSNQNPNQ